MDLEQVWHHTVRERRALGDVLAALRGDEWTVPSACAGWTVKDVAAHVIGGPQQRWPSLLPFMLRGRFDFNRAMLVDGQRRGRVPVHDLLDQFERYAGVRRPPPTTTPYEALIDVLVHTQDLLRPLGRTHLMPPEAALVATERAIVLARYFGRPPLDRVRLVATDIDWSRGTGPTVAGPMQEILLLATGRSADSRAVTGDGTAVVRTA